MTSKFCILDNYSYFCIVINKSEHPRTALFIADYVTLITIEQ